MSTFDSTKRLLPYIPGEIAKGKVQLPAAEILHGQQVQYPRYTHTATFKQVSRRQTRADPQQALL